MMQSISFQLSEPRKVKNKQKNAAPERWVTSKGLIFFVEMLVLLQKKNVICT
jgi:hypothetical protein